MSLGEQALFRPRHPSWAWRGKHVKANTCTSEGYPGLSRKLARARSRGGSKRACARWSALLDAGDARRHTRWASSRWVPSGRRTACLPCVLIIVTLVRMGTPEGKRSRRNKAPIPSTLKTGAPHPAQLRATPPIGPAQSHFSAQDAPSLQAACTSRGGLASAKGWEVPCLVRRRSGPLPIRRVGLSSVRNGVGPGGPGSALFAWPRARLSAEGGHP